MILIRFIRNIFKRISGKRKVVLEMKILELDKQNRNGRIHPSDSVKW